jgi:hypothetical protein
MGGAPAVLGPAGVDLDAARVPALAFLARELPRHDIPLRAVEDDPGSRVRPKVVVPGGVAVLDAITTSLPSWGTPSTGNVRRRLLFAPVVVSITTGSPASDEVNVARPRVSR